MTVRSLARLTCVGALMAACGSSQHAEPNEGPPSAGSTGAGRGGSGAAAGGTVDSGGSGTSVGGTTTAGTGTEPGAGGHAGSMSAAGSAQGGSAGLEAATGGAPQAGSTNGGNPARAGQGGALGESGEAGAAGTPGLDVGEVSVELVVTMNGQTSHVTKCGPNPPKDSTLLAPDANGTRIGQLVCAPELSGDLDVFQFSVVGLTNALGEHDATALSYDCSQPDGCTGVGTVVIAVSTHFLVSPAKSGTFTLDALDDSGHMSGSLDLIMTNASGDVSVSGTFAATLLDCTQFAEQTCPE